MDFSNVSQVGVTRILAAAGTPPLVVGLEPIQGAGKSYESVIRGYADLTLRPDWRSMCAALQQIVPGIPSATRLWVDTGDIAALQDGQQVKAQVVLIKGQALLALDQAGYTAESAVAAVESGDMTLLKPKPLAPPPPAGVVQHLLPQTPPGVTADALPPSAPRLPVGSTSPGDGGNNTRPSPRPTAARRALNGSHDHG
jgi:hypothetical protein